MTVTINASVAGGSGGTEEGGSAQPLDDKLTQLASISTEAGVFTNVDGNTVTIIPVGVGAATDILNRTSGDGRYTLGLGVSDSLISNGDQGIRFDKPYRGALVERIAGVDTLLDNSYTHADMLAISAPPTGLIVFCTTIALGGDAGTTTINTFFRYDGTYWRPLNPFKLLSIVADTASVTNSVTSFQANYSIAPPAGLMSPGMQLVGEMRSKTTLNGTPTSSVQISWDGSALIGPTQTIDVYGRHHFSMWCRSANIMIAHAGNTAMIAGSVSTTATATMASAFNGTRVMAFGHTNAGPAASDVTILFEELLLWVM